MLDTAVAFIFFNKIDTTKKVFEQICKAKPKKLYLISDGARADKQGEAEIVNDLRQWVESSIDWDAEVVKLYAEQNMGCGNRIKSGLDHVFGHEEKAIIVEDDCLPTQSFFIFCEDLLEFYKDKHQVMMVSGSNCLPRSKYSIAEDYTFTSRPWIWGWATWARAWKLYDEKMAEWPYIRDQGLLAGLYDAEMQYKVEWLSGFNDVYDGKLDTWDYQWFYTILTNNGLSIAPKYNLVKNLGFASGEATHTTDEIPDYLEEAYSETENMVFPIKHVNYIMRDWKFDQAFEKVSRGIEYTIKGRMYHKYLELKSKL